MKQFQLTLFKGHPIINDGENTILIDTGSPSTIHASESLNFCSERFKCKTSYMNLTVSEISKMLGTEITTLLGTDVLSKFNICFDYKNKVIEFNKDAISFEGTDIDISNFMGIPIVEFKIENQNYRFFLDTCAKLSYLSDSITANYENVGTDEDFYPGLGTFETLCYEIPTSISEVEFMVKYGNLPAQLESTLKLGGTDGIVGFDFFNNFKVVLDLKNNSLKYARLE